jgi:hypothetical protein
MKGANKKKYVKEVMKENCKSALRGVKKKSNKKKSYQNDFMMKEMRKTATPLYT